MMVDYICRATTAPDRMLIIHKFCLQQLFALPTQRWFACSEHTQACWPKQCCDYCFSLSCPIWTCSAGLKSALSLEKRMSRCHVKQVAHGLSRTASTPIINAYKLDFTKRRLLQTITGGFKFPRGAPCYFYLLQLAAIAVPLLCGGKRVRLCSKGAAS